MAPHLAPHRSLSPGATGHRAQVRARRLNCHEESGTSTSALPQASSVADSALSCSCRCVPGSAVQNCSFWAPGSRVWLAAAVFVRVRAVPPCHMPGSRHRGKRPVRPAGSFRVARRSRLACLRVLQSLRAGRHAMCTSARRFRDSQQTAFADGFGPMPLTYESCGDAGRCGSAGARCPRLRVCAVAGPDQPGFVSVDDGMRSVTQREFGQDPRDVCFHRGLADD